MTPDQLKKMMEVAGCRLVATMELTRGISPEVRLANQFDPDWYPLSEMLDRHDGGYLLHGPALMHADFNPEGVERGYWQDGAWPGSACTNGPCYWIDEKLGDLDEEGPGAWCVPGWDSNGDVYFTRFVGNGPEGITHFARVPRGPHSFEREARSEEPPVTVRLVSNAERDLDDEA